ncbi:TetR/AcrR family transcriptional regulator [Mycoplasmatota bacterium WC44]
MVFIPTKTYFKLNEEKQRRIFDAAVDEFAENDYDHAMISNIIKHASIPRGSFYQYFDDKLDLYKYIMEKAGEEKLKYMTEIIANPHEVPFLTLFEELYKLGLKFAVDNPKFVKIMSHLIRTKGPIYDLVMADSIDKAISFYSELIDLDKKRGRIRDDINTKVLAKLITNMTINVSTDSLNEKNSYFDYDKMLEEITQIIYIFEKGIKVGD